MLLKRAHINKVKVIRKYMSSTLTEIFTSQKTLGQCTVYCSNICKILKQMTEKTKGTCLDTSSCVK